VGIGGNGGMAAGITESGGMTSVGRDEDGWINGWMTGIGPTGGGSAMAGTTNSGAVVTGVVLPPPSERLGLGTKIFGLALNFLLWLLRNAWSLMRKVWSFRVW